jgi:hypothetical protein
MAFEPEILAASESLYTEDIIVISVLVDPDTSDVEFAMARAVANPGEPVRTLAFSRRLASTDEEDLGPLIARRDEWIAELASFSL